MSVAPDLRSHSSTSTTTTAPVPAPRTAPRPARHDVVARTVLASTVRPWLVLLLGALVVAAAVVGLGTGIRTTSAEDQAVGDSAVADRLVAAADFGTAPTETVVVTAADGGRLGQAELDALAEALRDRVGALPEVAGVSEPLLSADGRTAIVGVELDATDLDTTDAGAVATATEPVVRAREAVAEDFPDLDVLQVGSGSIDLELGEALEADFVRAELLAIPVTLLVLLVAFGAGVAALVPVAVGMSSVVVALGLTALVSQVVPVDQNAQSLVLLIGLAVGVDYALFVLRRTREERRAGLSPRAAVAATGATAVRSVVVSGITVVVAMAGLLVAGGMFTSLGIGTAAVVLVSVVASATVLPALLAVLGDRVESLRMPWRRRAARRAEEARPVAGEEALGPWGRLAAVVTRRPLLWGGSAAAALLLLAAPALDLRTAIGGTDSLPEGFDTITAYETLEESFPTEAGTVDVVVAADPEDAAAVGDALVTAHQIALAAGAATGDLAVVASVDGDVHVLSLGAVADPTEPESAEAVDTVRGTVVPEIEALLADVGVDAQVAVTGEAAGTLDFTRWLDQRLPLVIGFVLVLTLVVMAVSFGSLWLAAATVGLNLLSVGAAYGILVLVFQGTWAEDLLGFTSTGTIASWLPLMLFVILFGLSMDYHVFVVSRVREAYLDGADARRAVVVGVARSAGVVTSAAAVMVAVFAIFGTLSLLEMKQMGVGLAVAVLLDATLVRGVLLPAVLAGLGERAHRGPRWLPALHG
jgi:RND superfamily putative drug exporter